MPEKTLLKNLPFEQHDGTPHFNLNDPLKFLLWTHGSNVMVDLAPLCLAGIIFDLMNGYCIDTGCPDMDDYLLSEMQNVSGG